MPSAGLDRRPTGQSASDFESELADVAAEDERALAESAELERMYAEQIAEEQNKERTQNRMAQMATRAIQKEIGTVAKTAAKRAALTAARSIIVTTAPYWGSALLVLGLLIMIVVILFVVLDNKCNQSGLAGMGNRLMSSAAAKIGYVPVDVCKTINSVKSNIGLAAPSSVAPDPAGAESDLVSLGNLPTSGVSNPQVRACFLPKVQAIISKAQAAGLSVVITSAYRPGVTTATGGVSAHARGEAVDLALRNPVGFAGDPRVRTLVQIAEGEGFVPPVGDTLDEYARPAENATGGHVHVEYNSGYCDQQYTTP